MGRKVLAVVVALFLGLAIFLIVQMIVTSTLFASEAPKNMEYMTWAERTAYFSSLSYGAYVTVLIFYIIGTFAAGWIVAKISKDWNNLTLPILVGILFIIGGLITFFAIFPGSPAWFIILSLIVFIPMAVLGHKFAR
jgi:hypothetical protein